MHRDIGGLWGWLCMKHGALAAHAHTDVHAGHLVSSRFHARSTESHPAIRHPPRGAVVPCPPTGREETCRKHANAGIRRLPRLEYKEQHKSRLLLLACDQVMSLVMQQTANPKSQNPKPNHSKRTRVHNIHPNVLSLSAAFIYSDVTTRPLLFISDHPTLNRFMLPSHHTTPKRPLLPSTPPLLLRVSRLSSLLQPTNQSERFPTVKRVRVLSLTPNPNPNRLIGSGQQKIFCGSDFLFFRKSPIFRGASPSPLSPSSRYSYITYTYVTLQIVNRNLSGRNLIV